MIFSRVTNVPNLITSFKKTIMRKQIFLWTYLVLTVIIFSCGKQQFNNEKKAKENEAALKSQKTNGTQSVPEYCDDLPNPCTDPACAKYYDCDETIYYAGVQITYETSSGMLKFNSAVDVNTVIEQLNTDCENYNSNYENQYPNLTADQLDSVDVINNFDEFSPIRQFEGNFSEFVSKRSQIETIENAWLTNSMTGTDPDAVDKTFDDGENAIFNGNYQLKIGTVIYQPEEVEILAAQANGSFSPMGPICITNKKRTERYEPPGGNTRFKLKVAINSWYGRSGAKGKVVSFKRKNNNWKRARTKLAVFCVGGIYSSECSQSFTFSDRNPSPSGFKKRKQLKVSRHQPASVWKTKYSELAASFEAENIAMATLILQ